MARATGLHCRALTERLTIQTRTAISQNTLGEDTQTWTDGTVVYGSIEPLSGYELLAAKQIAAEATHRIRVRYTDGLTPRNRLAYRLFTFTAVAATDILTVASRAPKNGERVRVANTGGALPAGLAANTYYFVVSASGSTCKLAATLGGAAIDITGAGTGTQYFGERIFDLIEVVTSKEERRAISILAKETM